MKWNPRTGKSMEAMARVQIGFGVSLFAAVVVTFFTLPVSIIINAAFSSDITALEAVTVNSSSGFVAGILILVYGVLGLVGGFYLVKAGLENLDAAQELNKGFNRTPESSGPAKPSEPGGGAG